MIALVALAIAIINAIAADIGTDAPIPAVEGGAPGATDPIPTAQHSCAVGIG